MVLFHFPPLGGVSMSRNVRNVEYLPRHGWTPVVLASWDASGPLDPDALALVPPATRIIRARCLEPRDLRGAVTPLLHIATGLRRSRLIPARSTSRDGNGVTGAAQGTPRVPSATQPAPRWLWRVHRLLSFPDGRVGWLPFALSAGMRAVRTRSFDVVYSTSPPVTAHLVAGTLARLGRVPWVAEFRDPWLGNPITEAVGGPLPWLHRRLQVRIERWIVRSADRIVFVSQSTARLYRRRYPGAGEMVTIPNGHDRSEVIVRGPAEVPSGRFRIVWTGTLDRPEELRVFLEALERLAAHAPDTASRLEVVFYGHMSDASCAIADQLAAEGRVPEFVRFAGFVPRRAALSAVVDADAALVMLGAGPGMGQFIPGKLFDYIGQGKQILAVLPPGDARDILLELGWGVIADPEAADIERAIERLMTLPPPAPPADPEGRYDREALAGRLADTLGAASDHAHRVRTKRSPSPPGARDAL
jgi:glycosyltransferase involved in cell wall biosynthesis